VSGNEPLTLETLFRNFNENYRDPDKYPDATFRGVVSDYEVNINN